MGQYHFKQTCRLNLFMRAVPKCSGSIRFVSDAGDDLDLKSAFGGVIFASAALGGPVPDGRIVLTCPEDFARLSDWLEPEE